MIYVYKINKKPRSLPDFVSYLQATLTNVQDAQYMDESIYVYFPTNISGADKNTLDSLINAYTQYDNITTVKELKITEETIKTQGNFRIEGLFITTPANTTQTQTYSWNYPINVLGLKFHTPAANNGDIVNGCIAPTMPVAILATAAQIGDQYITISTPVASYIKNGFKLYTNPTQPTTLGYILETDLINNRIKLEAPLTTSIAASTPLYVEIHVVKNLKLYEGMRFTIGDLSINATYVPQNTPIVLKYTNTHLTANDFTFLIEYLY